MSDFRPLTGLYRRFLNGLPLGNAQIKIKLSKNDYNLEAGYPVLDETITTTETGHIPEDTQIWKTVRGLDGAKVVFVEPDGFKWEAPVPDGDGPISVQELRANGTVLTPPETVLALIANTPLGDLRDVDFDALADGDVLVWDADLQKFVNRQIEGGSGGGAEMIDELDDVLITSPASGDFFQYISGLWVNRSLAQVKNSLSVPATTNGLTEGTNNKYFTAERVLEVVLTGISFAADTAITAADSVLIALGKLQAQVSDLFISKAEKRVEYAADINATSFILDGTMLGKIQPCSNGSDITVTIGDDLGGGFNVGLLKTSASANKILFVASGDVTLIFPTGHSKSDSFQGALVSIHTPDGHDFYISGATAI